MYEARRLDKESQDQKIQLDNNLANAAKELDAFWP
jgi:hypothetical protein